MRIGVFGGSFDPIHHGHLIVGRAAVEALDLERLLVVPAGAQPLKGGRHGAPPRDRAAMVAAAVAGDSTLQLETAEVDRTGPSFTVDTLRVLRARWPEATLVLLLGADAVRELDRWREPEAVRALAEIAVLSRPGSDLPRGDWTRVPVPAIEISATEVRRRVRAGLPVRYWVPDAVAGYIASHGLYRDGDKGEA